VRGALQTTCRGRPPPRAPLTLARRYDFHFLEFWSNAIFNIVTGVVLYNATADKLHEETLRWPTLIKRFALLDIVTSFIAAVINTIDQPYFEPIAHNLEYVSTITMILIDNMMWNTLAVSKGVRNPVQLPVLLLLGGIMVVLYNTLPDPYNEFASHWIEHPMDIVGGLVVFYTSAESKRMADIALFHTMYRPCRGTEKAVVEALPA
jgi:hypothetical protein